MHSSSAADKFDVVLRRLTEGSKQYFGTSQVAIEPVSLQERPFSSLLRVRVREKNRAWYAYIKVLRAAQDRPEQMESARRRIANEFENLSRIYKALAGCPDLSVARPVVCFPEDFCLVTEEAPGRILPDILDRPVFWNLSSNSERKLIAVFERIGLWLKAFQNTGVSDGMVSIAAMRQYLDERLNLLCSTTDFTPAHRQTILNYFDAQGREIPEDDLICVPIHADFCPSNIVVHEDGITVLDFSRARTGEMYRDLAHLFMHMQNLQARPWIGRRLVEESQNAMLRAFHPALDPQRPLFQLLLLQQLVCNLVDFRMSPPSFLRGLYHRYVWRENRSRLRMFCS